MKIHGTWQSVSIMHSFICKWRVVWCIVWLSLVGVFSFLPHCVFSSSQLAIHGTWQAVSIMHSFICKWRVMHCVLVISWCFLLLPTLCLLLFTTGNSWNMTGGEYNAFLHLQVTLWWIVYFRAHPTSSKWLPPLGRWSVQLRPFPGAVMSSSQNLECPIRSSEFMTLHYNDHTALTKDMLALVGLATSNHLPLPGPCGLSGI